MSLLEPLKIQTTFFPTILSFMSSSPATERDPAGSRMMAYYWYISSIVLATRPSSTKVSSNLASVRISFDNKKNYPWNLSSIFHWCTINKCLKIIQYNSISCFQWVIHTGRTKRFESHELSIWGHLNQITHQTWGETTSTNTSEYVIQIFVVCPILQYLSSQASLTLNNFLIIKGVNKNCIILLFKFSCFCHCIIKSVSS